MSRAFVKEGDGSELDELPERLHSDLPNYITLLGLRNLERRTRNLEATIVELRKSDQLDAKSKSALAQRDLRYFRERIRRAIPRNPPLNPSEVQFGVRVTVIDADDNAYLFVIVGEDETDIDHGRVSWASPIAKALVGCKVGDVVTWHRGNENIEIEVARIEPHGK